MHGKSKFKVCIPAKCIEAATDEVVASAWKMANHCLASQLRAERK
jgi:hypothetical protein